MLGSAPTLDEFLRVVANPRNAPYCQGRCSTVQSPQMTYAALLSKRRFRERSQMGSHMPTLEEIAKLSQVSRSTVSRVVNNDPHVSTETRAKVMAVVRDLDYQPNAMAQSLAAGRTRILGLIVPSGIATAFRDPSLQVIMQAVASTCAASNYSVMLWLIEPDYELRMLRQVLGNGMLDGAIVSSIHLPEAALGALISSRLPYIVIGQPTASGSESSYVDVENRRGARELVTHLLRLGRRKVAHIAGPQDTVCARDRLQGYRDALTAVPTDRPGPGGAGGFHGGDGLRDEAAVGHQA